MKNWIKALIVTGIVCVGLVGLSMLIAYGIMATHGQTQAQTVETSNSMYTPKAHHEKHGIDSTLDEESRETPSRPHSNSDIDTASPDLTSADTKEYVHNLDDTSKRDALVDNGLNIKPRTQVKLQVGDNSGSTNYVWTRD